MASTAPVCAACSQPLALTVGLRAYECGSRAHYLHNVCFLELACGQPFVQCPGAACGASCRLEDWRRLDCALATRTRDADARPPAYRYAQLAACAPRPIGAPRASEAESLARSLSASYELVMNPAGGARPTGLAHVFLAQPAEDGDTPPRVLHVLLDKSAPERSVEGAANLGALVFEYLLEPSVRQNKFERARDGDDTAGLDELIDDVVADPSAAYAFFHSALRGFTRANAPDPASSTSNALNPEERRVAAAAAVCMSVAIKGSAPSAHPRIAAWLAGLLSVTNAPYAVRTCASQLSLADSVTAVRQRLMRSRAARPELGAILGRDRFGLMSFDNIGFVLRSFGLKYVQYVTGLLQILDADACRSLRLIGDSADVAASTVREDYESRDDGAKRATFETSTLGALALFERRFAATLAHALYLDATVPAGLYNRDEKGSAFTYQMGSEDLQAAGVAAAAAADEDGEDGASASEEDEGGPSGGARGSLLRSPASHSAAVDRLLELGAQLAAQEQREDGCAPDDDDDDDADAEADADADADDCASASRVGSVGGRGMCAGASEGAGGVGGATGGRGASSSRALEPEAGKTMFDMQIGTVASTRVVTGNLSEVRVLTQDIVYPLLAAARLPPYVRPDDWPQPAGPQAAPTADAGQQLPVHNSPPAEWHLPWPKPLRDGAATFARTPTELTQQMGVFLRGDGDPESKINRLRDKDSLLRHTCIASDGGFHTLQALVKSINLLAKPLLETILRDPHYRNTIGQRHFFYTTSDPSQPLVEHAHMYLAIMVEFAHQLRANKPDATPADLHAYMLARAAEAPIAAKTLEYCRLVELLLMLRDSERESDVQAYRHANALALGHVFALTNSFNYVRNICERLLRWSVASPADRIVAAELLLTMRTRHGTNVFCDRWFEHVQRYMRMACGHQWSQANHERIERVGGDVKSFAESRTRSVRGGGATLRRPSSQQPARFWHKSWMADAPGPPARGPLFTPSIAFRSAQRLLRNSHLAGGFDDDGAPTGLGAPVLAAGRGQKMAALAAGEYVSLHNRSEALCAEGLCAFSIGPPRVRAYTDQWYVQSRHVLHRDGERSAFSQLNQYAKPLKALADFRYARATTLNVELIMTKRSHGKEHFMTADYMMAELGARRLDSRCVSLIPAKLPKGSRPLAELLVKARNAARDTLPDSLEAFLADGSVPTSSIQPPADGSQPRELVVLRDGEPIRPLEAPLLALQGLAALPAAQIAATAWRGRRPGATAALPSAAAAAMPSQAAGAAADLAARNMADRLRRL